MTIFLFQRQCILVHFNQKYLKYNFISLLYTLRSYDFLHFLILDVVSTIYIAVSCFFVSVTVQVNDRLTGYTERKTS